MSAGTVRRGQAAHRTTRRAAAGSGSDTTVDVDDAHRLAGQHADPVGDVSADLVPSLPAPACG